MAIRIVGLIGIFVFPMCFLILLRPVFEEGRMWLFWTSCSSFVLFGIGFATIADDAKDDGRSEGIIIGHRLGTAGTAARTRSPVEEAETPRLPLPGRP